MGCNSSKQLKASVDVYRPAPSSFAVFDINAIEEPWLKAENQEKPTENQEKPTEKPTHLVPTTILEKLEAAADAPHSWDEVSKALENHLKPTATSNEPPPATLAAKPQLAQLPAGVSKPRRKSFSFHTLEELEARSKKPSGTTNSNKQTSVSLRKTESMRTQSPTQTEPPTESSSTTGFRSVKENIFLVRDRMEKEKEGKKPVMNWDPLMEFPEKCPPGGADSVVVYTTSLRGVRRTYEDCTRVRAILEQQGVVFDERDVSLHGGFLSELKELLEATEGAAPPRMFLKGRYLGGAEEVVGLNESGRLGRMLRWARVERVGEEGRQTCEGCGGVRWLPCLECGGSCKVRTAEGVGGEWARCGQCNENGLVRCPACQIKGIN